jgi:hypothetical protein
MRGLGMVVKRVDQVITKFARQVGRDNAKRAADKSYVRYWGPRKPALQLPPLHPALWPKGMWPPSTYGIPGCDVSSLRTCDERAHRHLGA